jgi:hypothetical protein
MNYMTFWESIRHLRRKGLISRQWRVSDIRPHLKGQFAMKSIETIPANQSISRDGKVKGDYVLRRNRPPMAFRLGNGLYELIDDPTG